MNWLFLGGLVLIAAFLLLPRLKWVSPEAARASMEAGAILVDVRTPGEFTSGAVPGAVNVPMDSLPASPEAAPGWNADTRLLLYCASGARSGHAARLLRERGFASVENLGSFGRARKLVSEGKAAE